MIWVSTTRKNNFFTKFLYKLCYLTSTIKLIRVSWSSLLELVITFELVDMLTAKKTSDYQSFDSTHHKSITLYLVTRTEVNILNMIIEIEQNQLIYNWMHPKNKVMSSLLTLSVKKPQTTTKQQIHPLLNLQQFPISQPLCKN